MAVRPLRMYSLCGILLPQMILLEKYLHFCLSLLTFRINKHLECKLMQNTHMPLFSTCLSISSKVFSMLSIQWPLTESYDLEMIHRQMCHSEQNSLSSMMSPEFHEMLMLGSV